MISLMFVKLTNYIGGQCILLKTIMSKNDTKIIVEINREFSMRFWNKHFGKATEAIDFAGRKIVKGAYNDRDSKYGWNIDHILPQSRGGKTAEHNLVICHIKTNDEKADCFPTFKANENTFQIIKVQNHYEIKDIEQNGSAVIDDINFYDSAAAIEEFKRLKGIQNKPRFVGTIFIYVYNLKTTAVVNFIDEIMDEEHITYKMDESYYDSITKITIKNYDMPLKDDVQKLLDKCVLLNTYFDSYFIPKGIVSKYQICYRVDYYKNNEEMYLNSQNITIDDYNGFDDDNPLLINALVYNNTIAKDKKPNIDFENYNQYTGYNYEFTTLAKNLKKEASK